MRPVETGTARCNEHTAHQCVACRLDMELDDREPDDVEHVEGKDDPQVVHRRDDARQRHHGDVERRGGARADHPRRRHRKGGRNDGEQQIELGPREGRAPREQDDGADQDSRPHDDRPRSVRAADEDRADDRRRRHPEVQHQSQPLLARRSLCRIGDGASQGAVHARHGRTHTLKYPMPGAEISAQPASEYAIAPNAASQAAFKSVSSGVGHVESLMQTTSAGTLMYANWPWMPRPV